MNHRCGICGNAADNTTHAAREMLFGFRDTFEYFQCSSCACLQITRPPENLGSYYPPEYYSFNQSIVPRPKAPKRFFKRRRTLHFLNEKNLTGLLMLKLFGPPLLEPWVAMSGLDIDCKILDVGCGNGHLLSRLSNEGFSDLTGIDAFVEKDRHFDHGFSVYRRPVEKETGTYDFIMLHHSFEHVVDPQKTLRALREAAAPDSRVLIRIPVVSWAWEHYGVNWIGLDAPRHLWLHSARSMELLCRQCGFDIEAIHYDSTAFQFWGSEQYRRDIPFVDERSPTAGEDQSLFEADQMAAWDRMARDLNRKKMGDQACFWLRRAD